ncbi:MAG TPA: sigma-70 family RNA polymerase sigma factor [Solirubrobacteraceae bacterium]|nr:sigma-70 family RNA polymerase sigma factor [Solirubrobacteraceae bacterium]
MSPLSLRRYRAERLLREEFECTRARVLASVRARLRARGASLDESDLECCYAQAAHGLYEAVLEGQEIANPAGWLTVVTLRRALDEHRACSRVQPSAAATAPGGARAEAGAPGGARGAGVARGVAREQWETETAAAGRDLAEELHDRVRLRQLLEAIRCRLDGREREAAALCYLHGLSRAQAASLLGVSERRMRKLMEGAGAGRPGVARKVGALAATISEGRWCEQQGSLMRALAFGILDPAGERYAIAVGHAEQCPACRCYVLELRGLAAALPPLLPFGLATGALAQSGEGAHGGAAASHGAANHGAGVQAGGGAQAASGAQAAGGAQAGAGVQAAGGASAAGAAGAAGAGAAGGGWIFAGGPLGAKLAVSCVLALGVGAGCVALELGRRMRQPAHAHAGRATARAGAWARRADAWAASAGASGPGALGGTLARAAPAPLAPAAAAQREFGPEQLRGGASAAGDGTGASAAVSGVAGRARARAASAGSSGGASAASVRAHAYAAQAALEAEGAAAAAEAPATAAQGTGGGDSAAAEREFSPG